MGDGQTFTAFLGHRLLAHGGIEAIAAALPVDQQGAVLVLDDGTGRPVDLDMRHGVGHAVSEHRNRTPRPDEAAPARPGRGRPRLGVVAREVTLLPRHWDWLATQPGGASAAIRRLVEEARRSGAAEDETRQRQDALYHAMSALAGDAPRFEDAARALFARDDAGFDAIVVTWPVDVAAYLARLAQSARDARSPG